MRAGFNHRSGGGAAAGARGLMRVREIGRTAELEALRPEWERLWERCPGATPFQSPEWLLAWWRHLGRGRLWALGLYEGRELVGLAPLFRHSYYGLPLRGVSLLGSGVSDYLDWLLLPGISPQPLWDHLQAARWDFCDFQQLPEGSPLLPDPDLRGVARRLLDQEVCPVLALGDDAERPLQVVPAKLRGNLRYYRRRLERLGEVELGAASEVERDAVLEALFRLHAARWRSRGLPGVFTSGRVRRFHAEVAAGFQRRGWLGLYSLKLRGEICGALYCFGCRRRGYYYAGGFAPALAGASPGTQLIGYAIEAAVRKGAREFDFLRGDEPYKYLWGAKDRVNRRLLLWREAGAGRIFPHLNRTERAVESAVKRAARRL